MELIDKTSVIAQIERRIASITSTMAKLYYAKNYKQWKAMVIAYKDILSFINTLEVKNVNLDGDYIEEINQ